jgi:hypothetical protein
MDKPEWLPEELDSNKVWDQLEDEAYEIFCSDFLRKPTIFFRDKTVKLNLDLNIVQSKEREKSFYHLTKKTEDKISRRIINDPLRTARIGWVRPLIENSTSKDILCWDYWESIGLIRTYIWIVSLSYVVILQEEPTEYIFISAYFVDRPERLWKKYNNRIK